MRGRVIAGAAGIAVLVAATAACEPGPIAGQGYAIVFEDDFDYLSQDAMDDVWELHAPFLAPPQPQSITFHTDPADPANRFVRLTTGAFRNWEWTYISTAGVRRQSPEPNYPNARSWQGGYFEARLRYTSNEWAWPAFWLFSHDKSENWPDVVCPPAAELVGEWDILDSGRFDAEPWAPDHYHGGIHKNTPYNGPWCEVEDEQRLYSEDPLAGMDLTQWHTWAGRWIEHPDGTGEMCVYVDAIEIGCHPTFPESAQQPLVVNLDIKHNGHVLGENQPPPSGTPDLSMDVDWVRVYQLP